MGKSRHIIFKLVIVVISFFFIDGGRSLLLISDNIQIILTQDHKTDFEIPHQHHIVNLSTDEKYLELFSFDFSCNDLNSVKFIYSLNSSTQEFSDSIWQPPKFV